MSKRKILIQLDADKHPSVFDRVVAVDSGVDELFSYGSVGPEDVEGLVHGAMFTRKPSDLASTAIFIGGRNVARAEELLAVVQKTFFGPMRNSVLLDANGANTTAAAAVLCAGKHVDLARSTALVLAATGPVGQRAALLLARQGASVLVGSRSKQRAADVCEAIRAKLPAARVHAVGTEDSKEIRDHAEKFCVVVAAGAAGARLLHRNDVEFRSHLKVLIDLNAVPPSGIEGVDVMDAGREERGVYHYGAIGVGGLKMKIHKAAVARLFEANNLVLDAEEVFDLGLKLLASGG